MASRGTGLGKVFSQPIQRSALERLDSARAFVENFCNLVDGKISNDPQGHHAALVVGQRIDESGNGIIARPLDCCQLSARRTAWVALRRPFKVLSPARPRPELVHQTSVGDGEKERPKFGLTPDELRYSFEDGNEHFAGEIFRLVRTAGPEKRGDCRRVLHPQCRESPPRSTLSRDERCIKRRSPRVGVAGSGHEPIVARSLPHTRDVSTADRARQNKGTHFLSVS